MMTWYPSSKRKGREGGNATWANVMATYKASHLGSASSENLRVLNGQALGRG